MKRALALLAVLAPGVGLAQETPRTPANLDRPATSVVVEGSRAAVMSGVPISELRLFAWKGGELRAVPFQIDERDPDELYAFTKGQQILGDTDDHSLDDNDELVFMARDAGDRLHPEDLPPDHERWVELRVFDPRTGGQAWVYLVRFLEPDGRAGPPREPGNQRPPRRIPPALSSERYVSFDWRGGEKGGELAGWKGHRVRVVGHPETRNFLDLHEVRFKTAGGYGPDVLDRAKLSFRGKYLFLDIRRHMDEMRARITGFLAGPVRLVASCALEIYMIWGHWIKTSRGRVKIYGNRLELDLEVDLPVSLETKNVGSEVRFSLDFLPSAGAVYVGSNTNLQEVRPDPALRDGKPKIDKTLPRWIYASLPQGSVLARLKLADDLQRPSHELFLRGDARLDAPEESPGSHGNAGYKLDLTGLEKGTYPMKLILQFGPKLTPGRPEPLLRVDDVPLRCETGRHWKWTRGE